MPGPEGPKRSSPRPPRLGSQHERQEARKAALDAVPELKIGAIVEMYIDDKLQRLQVTQIEVMTGLVYANQMGAYRRRRTIDLLKTPASKIKFIEKE